MRKGTGPLGPQVALQAQYGGDPFGSDLHPPGNVQGAWQHLGSPSSWMFRIAMSGGAAHTNPTIGYESGNRVGCRPPGFSKVRTTSVGRSSDLRRRPSRMTSVGQPPAFTRFASGGSWRPLRADYIGSCWGGQSVATKRGFNKAGDLADQRGKLVMIVTK